MEHSDPKMQEPHVSHAASSCYADRTPHAPDQSNYLSHRNPPFAPAIAQVVAARRGWVSIGPRQG